jgi:hypothetical protein
MPDFKLLSMERHEDGFFVARFRSFFTQQEHTVHDRYGSWLVGDPDARGEPMKEVLPHVAAILQRRRLELQAAAMRRQRQQESSPLPAPRMPRRS